jgi:membrane protein YqaA with SNARE-associated domain
MMKCYLENIFDYFRNLANTKYGEWLIFIFAVADSSILPFPSTTIFIMFSLLDIRKVYKYVIFFTLGTIAGSVIGYYIGHLVWLNSSGEFTGIAKTIFNNVPGFSEKFYNEIHVMYAKWGYRILLLAVCTPIPYCLFSISSGIFEINILVFILVTAISHGIKFLIVAILTVKSGKEVNKLPLRKFRRVAIISTIGFAILVFLTRII